MSKVSINSPAPDFILQDYQGNLVSLSHFKEKKNVLLVFNRGFT
jgi:peroxiredoxin